MADKYKEICGVEIAVASSQTRRHAAPCNLSIWIKIKVTMAQWHIQRFVVGHAKMDETKKKGVYDERPYSIPPTLLISHCAVNPFAEDKEILHDKHNVQC